MTVIKSEHVGSILGVEGRYHNVVTWQDNYTHIGGTIANQVWGSSRTKVVGRHKKTAGTCRINIRFDDQCRNGHCTFSITGSYRDGLGGEACGQIREQLSEFFPELEPLFKWHLCSTDGPMHYIGNTVYLAGNRDHWGLLKGEIKYGEEKPHVLGEAVYDWCERYRRPDGYLPLEHLKSSSVKAGPLDVVMLPEVRRVGEGKERELEAARRTAVWPEATDEQLCASEDELTAMLQARLPALLEEFRDVVVNTCGFLWEAPVSVSV